MDEHRRRKQKTQRRRDTSQKGMKKVHNPSGKEGERELIIPHAGEREIEGVPRRMQAQEGVQRRAWKRPRSNALKAVSRYHERYC